MREFSQPVYTFSFRRERLSYLRRLLRLSRMVYTVEALPRRLRLLRFSVRLTLWTLFIAYLATLATALDHEELARHGLTSPIVITISILLGVLSVGWLFLWRRIMLPRIANLLVDEDVHVTFHTEGVKLCTKSTEYACEWQVVRKIVHTKLGLVLIVGLFIIEIPNEVLDGMENSAEIAAALRNLRAAAMATNPESLTFA